jgi:hypothetical protein
MAGSAVASSLNLSSPTGLWQAMNMMQLFMLLLLFGVYLPVKIENFLSSSSFFSLNFDLPFLRGIPYFGDMLTYLDFSFDNSVLEKSGVNSGSSFINFLCQIAIFLLIMLIHLSLIPLKYCDPAKGTSKASIWFRKAGKWFWKFLTFTVYVRILIQTFQYLALVSISGIYYSSFKDLSRSFSFGISAFTLCLLLMFFLFEIHKWLEFTHNKKYQITSFNEFFSGLKKSKLASAYNIFLNLRKLVFLCWLICFQWLPTMVIIPSIGVYQILHTSAVIILRPFDHPKENFVEIANEIILAIVM